MHIHLQLDYNHNKFRKALLRPSDTTVVREACPICNGPTQPFTTVENCFGETVLERVICSPCQFVTFSRMPISNWFEDYYRNEWDISRNEEEILQKVEAPYGPLFEVLIPAIPNIGASLLEIGAGYGGALKQLRDLGYQNLVGIEPSYKRRDYCVERLGLNVTTGSSKNISLDPLVRENAPYDIIFSWHAIEHIFDLHNIFGSIRDLLKPDGLVMLGVPDLSHEHLVYLSHFVPHIHSFTQTAVRRLLNRFGFAVELCDDQIRAVGRKLEVPLTDLDGIDSDATSKLVRRIFVKHLGTDKLPATEKEGLVNIFGSFNLEMFQPSEGQIHSQKSLSARHRLFLMCKTNVIGPGRNLKPILHPHVQMRNVFDLRNAAMWLCHRWLPFTSAEFSGSFGVEPRISDTQSVDRITIAYDQSFVYGWLK